MPLLVLAFIASLTGIPCAADNDEEVLTTKKPAFFEEIARQMADLNEQKAFDKTIELGEKYASFPANRSSAFLNELGFAYSKAGKATIAKKCFEKAIELKPDDAVSYYNLGLLYVKTGDEANALLNLRKSLDLNPSHKYADKAKSWIKYYDK